MATLNGKAYTKADLLRHTGNPGHIAGFTPFRFEGGKADGSRGILLRTGSGLEAILMPDRNLDILSLSYRGTNLSFVCKNGPTSPNAGLPTEGNFNAAMEGGMLFTAGLLNAGPDSRDEEGRYHAPHGNIGFARAEQLSAAGEWAGDEYLLSARAVMRESRLFGENLTLTRRINTFMGSNTLELWDHVENHDSEPVDYAILYHCNLGFPFLSEDCEVEFPENELTPRTPEAEAGKAQAEKITEPADRFFEHVFFRKAKPDEKGWVTVKVKNPTLGMTFTLSYEQKNLPELIEWKSMRSGDYALGIEPANCRIRGRAEELKNRALPTLPGFGSADFRLRISVE